MDWCAVFLKDKMESMEIASWTISVTFSTYTKFYALMIPERYDSRDRNRRSLRRYYDFRKWNTGDLRLIFDCGVAVNNCTELMAVNFREHCNAVLLREVKGNISEHYYNEERFFEVKYAKYDGDDGGGITIPSMVWKSRQIWYVRKRCVG